MLTVRGQHPTTPFALVVALARHSSLIIQMASREAVGRYRGSVLGIVWSLFHPLLMLATYTLVFGVVFRARWSSTDRGVESQIDFALMLFIGMIVHSIFAEVINRAPGLIMNHPSYVRRVVFPLEILVPVALMSALIQSGFSLAILFLTMICFNGTVPPTVIALPFVMMPLIVLTLGLGWFLCSLGTYIRDIGQMVGVLTTALLFLSPLFYPLNSVPESVRPVIMANPLTLIIEQSREVLFWGRWPDWLALGRYSLVAVGLAWAGFWWFQRTRKGFADVV